jgi:predicted enzyme related to lactoylglutathione lyase
MNFVAPARQNRYQLFAVRFRDEGATMPRRDSAPTGAPCWIDIMTSDVQRAREFYTKLFGWTAGEPSPEIGGYFMFFKDDVPVAGGMQAQPGNDVPDAWSVYLATDDIRKTLAVAVEAGAQIYVDSLDVADLGAMAVIGDPGGAAIGLWEPRAFAGLAVLGETGTPAWFELHTRNYADAIRFYRETFGWQTETASDTAELRYTNATSGTLPFAGVIDATAFLPDGVPAHWSVYFAVDSADATIARLGELGGSVVQAAEDTPYGRLATVTDPMGATFKLLQPPAAATA